MDISYDIWSGESIDEIIQTIAEFRIQIFSTLFDYQIPLSEEINNLHQYFNEDSIIIVANDCSKFTGYLSLNGSLDAHQSFNMYVNFGDDLMITQGPLVHPYYREFNIEHQLLLEAVNECQIRDKQILLVDPVYNQFKIDLDEDVVYGLNQTYEEVGFNKIDEYNHLAWEKYLT